MIQRLRHKFVFILMSVVTLILLGIFVSILLFTQSGNRRAGEAMLRQALTAQLPGTSPGLPQGGGARRPEEKAPPANRLPFLLAEINETGEVTVLVNQLHFFDETEAQALLKEILQSGKSGGVSQEYSLRWLRSEDGARIALADISMEQEMLKTLVMNALFIGLLALAAFFFISLFLARWAVRPVELAWQRQRQFVADASHELKTPLTVILSNAEMLRTSQSCADEKTSRRLEHIRAEAKQMKRLVEDLLTLARADSAEAPKTQTRVNLSDFTMNTALAYEALVFDAGKTLDYEICEGLAVEGDGQSLAQLLAILMDNALKFCPTGGAIRVSLQRAEKNSLRLTVYNDGPPIAARDLPHLFERFYQADASRSAHGSFGLGLSIAQGIVGAHRGRIWAESKPEGGNYFYVSLPQKE